MATSYFASVRWERGADEFVQQRYSRGHTWHFDEGLEVPASASPHVVKQGRTVAKAVDPEEALAAAVSSCHMLFFLSDASRDGFVVERYEDAAEAVMSRFPDGRVGVTTVVLRPQVTFRGRAPDSAAFAKLHHDAHEQCFIANSIKGEVRCEPTSHTI